LLFHCLKKSGGKDTFFFTTFAQIFFDMDTAVKRARRVEVPLYQKQHLGEVLWTEQSLGNIIIPEEHKQTVRERIKKHENIPGSYLSWDDIEHKMATRK